MLPADLPLLTVKGIEELIALATDPPVVVIAPDRHGTGTNALLSSPPGLIEYDFGPNSFDRHLACANHAGVRIEICKLPSLELDIDLPEDLEILKAEQQDRSVSIAEE